MNVQFYFTGVTPRPFEPKRIRTVHTLRKTIYSVTTARKRSLGQGNMFTGVCLSTGVGAWSRGVPGPGGGVPGPGGAWWRPPRTATAAGGTHPTGMHSCFWGCCATHGSGHIQPISVRISGKMGD